MPRNKKKTATGDECKEIEQLKKRRKKAQDKGDTTEEAKLCNALGEVYIQKGDYKQALHYHQCELSLSEVSGDRLGYGIACRRVGECYCELEDYQEAMKYQKRHLEISRKLGDLAEEQRALATLGRTFYVHSQSELELKDGGDDLLLKAGSHYLQSLDMCDRLTGELPDRELLEMRSRLYLNLGLVYETKGDLKSGRKFMEKALDILKELGDTMTVFQCHFDLGHLHLKERHTSQALSSFQEALVIARELRNRKQEAEALREIAQVYVELSEFELAKSCIKRALKLSEALPQEDVHHLEKQLKSVRRVLSYLLEVDKKGSDEKARLYEKLGDICCEIKAYSSAVKFYGKQLSVAEEFLDLESRELSSIYVSLARTLSDCGQHSQALHYYKKNLLLWKGNEAEECDSWYSIALVRESAGMTVDKVMVAYNNSVNLAEEMDNPKKMMSLYKVIIKYISEHEDSSSSSSSSSSYPWRQKLSHLLESHPLLANVEDDDDEEDSQDLDENSHETSGDLSLVSSSSEEEEENEEEVGGVGGGGVVISERSSTREARNLSKLEKRNERGETLLQAAVINGDLTTVKRLIKKGAKVDARDNCGWMPLHEACNHGYLEIARLLVESGAPIDDGGGANCEGVTPLIDAATNGHGDVVKLLVVEGADLVVRDANGRTVLEVVESRLSLGSSDNRYELEEEHRKIRDYLRIEMRRRGLYVKEATPPNIEVEEEEEEEVDEVMSHQDNEVLENRSGHTRRRRTMKKRYHRWDDRTLYDSSEQEEEEEEEEEEEDLPIAYKKKKLLTGLDITSTFSKDLSSSPPPSMAINRNMSIIRTAGRSSLPRRVEFDPLGGVETPSGPALLPEAMEGEIDEVTGCPVLDKWLVDDIGDAQTKKKGRQQQRDLSVERQSRALVGFPLSSSRNSYDVRGGYHHHHHHHRRARCNKPPTSQKISSSNQIADSEERGVAGGTGGGACSRGSDRRKGTVESSDSEMEEDFLIWERNFKKGGNLECHTDTSDFRALSSGHVTSRSSFHSSPLRIKVRIGSSTYLIPCPLRIDGNKDTPISWLATQAAERYFSQKGKRPLLSLTTSDGASLCPADTVAHVLRQDEEIVGVVEEWFCPPLAERYQVACRTAGVECHPKVLELFEKSGLGSSLDLSNFDLSPRDPTPIFHALQSQHNLTALSFSGNRLRDEAMPRLQAALGGLPSLHSLDLSSTGITYQGINSLAKSSSSSALTGNSMWQSLHTLNVSHNKLGVASGSGLFKLLLLCKGLQELLLDACGLGYDVFEPHNGLGEALKCLSELRVLSLNNNPLGDHGICLLFKALRSLRVNTLNISRVISTKMTGAGGRPFSKLLQDKTTIEYFKEGGGQYLEILDVSHCSRGDGKAVSALMECLEHCSELKELRLAGWGLTGEHIEPICSFLSFADCLCMLDMSGNVSLGNTGALRLLNACCSRLHLGGVVGSQLGLKFIACGIESPLPKEFIRAVNFLQGSGRSRETGVIFKVELFGNLVDKRDMALISPSQQ